MVFSASSAPSAVNNLEENTFEINIVQPGLITLNIDLFNSGEENSILEYAVFTSTEPSGVEIENDKGYVSINDSKSAVIYLNPDYIEEGTSSFDVIVNSNGQTGNTSQTYKIVLHKYYQSWYQDWTETDEKPNVLSKPMVLTRYTYTGREYNRETGQYYYRARTYISSIGRFTGKDSLGYPGYEYVKNNPNIYNDPTGKSVLGWVIVGGIVIIIIIVGGEIYRLSLEMNEPFLKTCGLYWKAVTDFPYNEKSNNGNAPNEDNKENELNKYFQGDQAAMEYCQAGRNRCQACCINDPSCISDCQSYYKEYCYEDYISGSGKIKSLSVTTGSTGLFDGCVDEYVER